MTGSFAPDAAPAGFHTFTNRQSSDESGESEIGLPGRNAPWAQDAPNLLASRTPCHGLTACGGRQRKSPVGAAANGTPLKLVTSPSVVPRTLPDARRITALGPG